MTNVSSFKNLIPSKVRRSDTEEIIKMRAKVHLQNR